MRQVKAQDWTWHFAEPVELDSWFGDFEVLSQEHSVKHNDLRDVFTVKAGGREIYVKYHHPDSLFQKMRSEFVPKARIEFESAKLLEELQIPVVHVLAWGSCGSRSILLSVAEPDTVSARIFWFREAIADKNKRAAFLRAFAPFIKILLGNGIYHPDLHLGNLLVRYRAGRCELILVDVYGVGKPELLEEKEFRQMIRVLGSLRGELSDAEAVEFLRLAGLTPSYEAAKTLWEGILQAEAKNMAHLWPKRREQILRYHEKYVAVFRRHGTNWLLRRGMDGEPMFPEKLVGYPKLPQEHYELRRMPHDEAEALWLQSFRLDFHRIPHRPVLAWIPRDDEFAEILIMRANSALQLEDGPVQREFIRRLKYAGISLRDPKSAVVLLDGKAQLVDPAFANFAD